MKSLLLCVLMLKVVKGKECPDNILLEGKDLLCPNQVGIYNCTTFNGLSLEWNINNGQAARSFGPTAEPVNKFFSPVASFYLITRDVGEGSIGNRSSVLEYMPDSNTVGHINITCTDRATTCTKTVLVIGNDNIEPPFNLVNRSDGNHTIHTWNQTREEMVDTYKIVLDSEVISGQEFNVNTSRVVVTRIPGLSYSGYLSSVSVCGKESTPVRFKVQIPFSTSESSSITASIFLTSIIFFGLFA